MPFNQVMGKFGAGAGAKTGPPVNNPKQAVALKMSEKQNAASDGDEPSAPKKKNAALAGLKRAVGK